MAVKSVISVDVQSEAFTHFKDLFDAYAAKLAATPDMWSKVSKEHAALSKNFQSMTAAMLAQQHIAQEGDEDGEKQESHLTRMSRLWTDMSKSTKSVSGHILSATASLLRWTGAISAVGGLLGAGGLFGIDRMAASAAKGLISSRGLGVSQGEMAAFANNFRDIGNPEGLMRIVSEAQSDPRQRWKLSGLGVNPNQDTTDASVAVVRAMYTRAHATPISQLGILDQTTGIDVGFETWRRMHDMSAAERDKMISGLQKDRNTVGPSDKSSEAWLGFIKQMERAKQTIFSTFVEGLVPLAGPLSHLSDSVVKFLKTLMVSDAAKEGIDKISTWLDSFAGKLGNSDFLDRVKGLLSDSGEFMTAVHAFVQNVKDDLPALEKIIHAIAHPLDAIADKTDNPVARAVGNAAYSLFPPDIKNTGPTPWNGTRMGVIQRSFGGTGLQGANPKKIVADIEAKNNLPRGMLATIWGMESSQRTSGVPTGAGDHAGPFQLSKHLRDAYGLKDAQDFGGEANIGGSELGKYFAEYGDREAAFTAYRWGEPAVNAAMDKARKNHQAAWDQYLPPEKRAYGQEAMRRQDLYSAPPAPKLAMVGQTPRSKLNIVARIIDATGGSVHASMAALAP